MADDYTDFEEEEARLFAGDDTDEGSPSKGSRLVPTQLTADFTAWLHDYHPEIRGFYELTYQDVAQLVRDFERFTGMRSNHTTQEWWVSLQRR